MSKQVSLERAAALLDYNPETGIFTRKVKTNPRAMVGYVAGSPNSHGHLRIAIDGVQYYAHRIAWLMVYGVWPHMEIDHQP